MAGTFVVIGDSPLAHGVERALRDAGQPVQALHRPTDRQLRRVLGEDARAAIVVERDDIAALRLALLVEYLRAGIRLVVTIFDRTVASQLIRTIPNCNVVSMADASVGSVLGPCVDPSLVGLHRHDDRLIGVREEHGRPRVVPYPYHPPRPAERMLRLLRAQLRPYDRAARLLLASLAGLLALVVLETLLALTTHHEPLVASLYEATKVITTVGPSEFLDTGSTWAKLYGVITMALALVLTAVFTAALVNRVLSRRLTGILGTRTIPRDDHVVVVGLGQVGFRLCMALRELAIEVVAVERDEHAPQVSLARGLKVPVVVGSGVDRLVLERLSLQRARALAAVTSDELANIAISVAALGVEPRVRTVLRAGSNEVTRETQALFLIGVAQDLDRVAAAALAATAMGHDLVHAFVLGDVTYIETVGGGVEPFPPPPQTPTAGAA